MLTVVPVEPQIQLYAMASSLSMVAPRTNCVPCHFQNLINSFLVYIPVTLRLLWKFIHNVVSYSVDKHTQRRCGSIEMTLLASTKLIYVEPG